MSEPVTFEALEQEVQDLLARLHDDAYRPTPMLCQALECDPGSSAASIQSAMLRQIAALAPPAGTPPAAYSRRVHDVLHYRYAERLTLEETAELLGLSVRHLARIQRNAVRALSRALWERVTNDISGARPAQMQPARDEQAGWQQQVAHELEALVSAAPAARADVAEVIHDVLALGRALTGGRPLEIGYVQPGIVAAIHPAAMRQMLVTAISRLARIVTGDRITVFARLEAGDVKVSLVAELAEEHGLCESDLTRTILLPEGASVQLQLDGRRAFVWLQMPSEGQINVLVVDDNHDMARLYQRATEGTRYRIVHVARGQDAFPTIEQADPALIVLDVMLPDVDGWRLLMHLHENPRTRHIPVIVCTVVHEERLALSLGAAAYLPKPVNAGQFVQALNQVLARA